MQLGWDTVGSFIKVLRDEGQKDSLYRGQASTEWDLIPSIYRPGSRGIANELHFADWKKQACRFVSSIPRDDVEWLVLAQHYGLATSLLDWTLSPLIALFFACDDLKHRHRDGCVWLATPNDFEEPADTLTISAFETSLKKPFLINAIGRNARSTAQDSFLSLHASGDLQSLGARRIFSVASEAKTETLQVLEILGIANERLHLDITKLVDRFKDEWSNAQSN